MKIFEKSLKIPEGGCRVTLSCKSSDSATFNVTVNSFVADSETEVLIYKVIMFSDLRDSETMGLHVRLYTLLSGMR
jgi:hypothetical protein